MTNQANVNHDALTTYGF